MHQSQPYSRSVASTGLPNELRTSPRHGLGGMEAIPVGGCTRASAIAALTYCNPLPFIKSPVRPLRLVLALAALLLGVTATNTLAQELVLEELLNRSWVSEPVSFEIEANPGECPSGSVQLRDPEGTIVPSQLRNVVQWPGTPFLQSAQVWFVSSLQPLQRRVYTWECSARPAPHPTVVSDLQITHTEDTVTFTTNKFGVSLRLTNGTLAEPVPAATVPGPMESLRLADGTWFGGSDFYGETRIRAWSSELTATGPIFGEVRYRYEYEDGNLLELLVRLFAEANRVQFDTDVLQDRREEGLRIVLSRKLPPLTLHVQKLWWSRRDIYPKTLPIGEWVRLHLTENKPGQVVEVSPWSPWWNDMLSPVVRLGIGDGKRELHIARRDPAAWVQPLGPAKHKNLPVRKTAEGDVYIDLNLAAGAAGGVRMFDLADAEPTETVGLRHRRDSRGRRVGSQIIPYQESLNEIKEYVLEWPRQARHPHIFMNAAEIAASRPEQVEETLLARLKAQARTPIGAVPGRGDTAALALWLLTGDDAVARKYHLADRLIHHLGLLGDFDKMRHIVHVAALYDALIDSDLITPEQRRILRAQMAYLAYQVAHPATWSNARGWNSGNQNMTVSYTLQAPGVMASVLADHPHARRWMEPALEVMESMLDKVGPGGEWPESTGYSNVSINELLTFGILATHAGFANLVEDPRLKRAVMFLIKIRQPPDPRVGGMRDHIRYGRSPGLTFALDAAMARAILETDPRYSRSMQWTWLDTLQPGAESRVLDMGGFEQLYLDHRLPTEPPDWGTEPFPHMGIIFRHGFGSDQEHFAALLSGDHPTMIYSSQTGGLVSLFAYGRPVAGSFLGDYDDQSEFLINRVSLARDPRTYVPGESAFYFRGTPHSSWWFDENRPQARFEEREGDGSISAFSSLPRQDYAAVDVLLKYPWKPESIALSTDLPWPTLTAGQGKPPLWWRRQALFLKDDDPQDANYLLLRDTVSGGQPTMWTFWSASEKLGTAEEAADREAFLNDAPGKAIVEPRLLSGDRFTALGSWGVDLEYYVAAPTDTPRHTMRWGKSWKVSYPWGVSQYQDLLHLQREDDGVYYVALFPRKTETPAPEFTSLADGEIIKVNGTFGTDYGFLSAREAEATTDVVCFRGTAGTVQDRAAQPTLALGAAGSVAYGEYAIASRTAVMLRVLPETLFLQFPSDHEGTSLSLRAPGGLHLFEPLRGVDLTRSKNDVWRLTVPSHVIGLAVAKRSSQLPFGAASDGYSPLSPTRPRCINPDAPDR